MAKTIRAEAAYRVLCHALNAAGIERLTLMPVSFDTEAKRDQERVVLTLSPAHAAALAEFVQANTITGRQ